MSTGLHSQLEPSEIHGPWRIVFADAAARLADSNTYTSADVANRITALQLDTGQGYYLTAVTPTWTEIGGMTTNDHGSLTGLGDDDHAQYVLRSILTTNGDIFIRSGGVVSRLGIGSNGHVLTVASGLPSWAAAGGGSDIRNQIVFDHFQSGNDDSDEHGWMGWRELGSGTGSSISYTGLAGHPGIVQINAGTAGGARRALALGDDVGGAGGRVVLGGANVMEMEALLRFPVAGDFDAANLEDCMVGLGLEWNGDQELYNGVYVRFKPGSDTNWSIVAANAGVRTVVSLGTAPVAGNWVRVGFSATSSSIQGRFNGADVGSVISTSIPPVGLGFGLKARSAGGAGAALQCDYISLTQVTDKET